MKKGIVLWLFCGFGLSCWGADDSFHQFTSTDDRTVSARILRVDPRSGMVELQLENKRKQKVSPSVFCDADQAYIKEWVAAEAFLSERQLKIELKKNKLKDWDKEEWGKIRYNGEVEEELMKTTMFQEIAYDVLLNNMNAVPLNNIRMEYCIYYEQSTESYTKPKVEQKVFKAKVDDIQLVAKKKATIVTEPVTIFKDSINSKDFTDGRSRIGGKGDVHGIRVRFYMTGESGTEFMREIANPSSWSEDTFPWKG